MLILAFLIALAPQITEAQGITGKGNLIFSVQGRIPENLGVIGKVIRQEGNVTGKGFSEVNPSFQTCITRAIDAYAIIGQTRKFLIGY